MTASIADRLGLRRSLLIGLICTTLAYLSLPFVSFNLTVALIMIFFIFLTFEFCIVTSMALSTELLPDARATMMAGNLAAAGLGRVCGTFLGGYLWIYGGIKAIGLISGLCCALALISLMLGLRNFKVRSSESSSPDTSR